MAAPIVAGIVAIVISSILGLRPTQTSSSNFEEFGGAEWECHLPQGRYDGNTGIDAVCAVNSMTGDKLSFA